MKVFYFGCYDDKGHHTRAAEGLRLRYTPEERDFAEKNPWGYRIDGGLCRSWPQIEGESLIHHKDGWTALSFWDRSIDGRPGSNSNFLAEGTYTFAHMVEIAMKYFPSVMKRFKFQVKEAQWHSSSI
jgi:hypothetical protein